MKKVFALVLSLALVLTAVSALAETNVNFWTVFTGDDGATLQSLVNEFNDTHPDIKVNHTPIAAADLYTKLPLAVQTGSEVPDIAIIHVERIPKLVDDEVLTDVEYLLENGVDKANYPDWVLEKTNFDGDQYGIPWDLNAGILYINTDLIAKYGLESLIEDGYVTFEEVKQAGEAIKAAGDLDTVKAINFYGGLNGYLPRYEEMGGVLLNEKGELALDTKIFADMLASLREINELGFAIGQNEDAKTLFIGGQLLFYEAGTWTIPTLNESGIKYTAVPMTCYSAETALMRSGSHTWAQPENEERTEETDKAVATFVNWMGEHSVIWSTQAGQVALYKGVTESEEFKALPQAFLAQNVMSEHVHVYGYYHWALLDSAIDHVGTDGIYDSSIDLVEVAKSLQAEVDDAIAAMN